MIAMAEVTWRVVAVLPSLQETKTDREVGVGAGEAGIVIWLWDPAALFKAQGVTQLLPSIVNVIPAGVLVTCTCSNFV